MPRERFVRQSLGASYTKIKQSRVLLVGAGGIGCELLKNLVLTGFGEIHIIDLDTIDLSNLNRQFLFRHEHIKKSKALVAKESAAKFNPHIKLEAYHADIKDPQFNIDWFQGFDIVFNALDNLDARRYVNKMCLAANVPLIESGTTGFNGQVQVIIKGKTECYDCNVKETPKTFPVCTIRSTPSQPIHCIVWGKSYLFTEVYGVSEDEEADTFDHSEDAENAEEIAKLRQEAKALKTIRQSMGTDEFPRKLFQKVFKDDIERLRSMDDMWKTRKPPNRLDFDSLSTAAVGLTPEIAKDDQKVWNEAENFVVFCDSLRRLNIRLKQSHNSGSGGKPSSSVLSFDKDDEDTLDFVAASANLRAIIFGIDPKSKFAIKQMAGNIIPAIATTNAMTAGLCVLQAFKVLRGDLHKAKMVFLERSTQRVINSEPLRPPNPNCSVCGVISSKLTIDPARATLNDLVEGVLKSQLGYGEEFSVNNEVGTLYDPDLDDNLDKKLKDLGIKSDSFLTVVDDDEENPRVNLSLVVSEKSLVGDAKPVQVAEKLEIARKPKAVPASESLAEPLLNGDTNGTNHGTTNGTTNGTANGITNGKPTSDETTSGSTKRKRANDDAAADPASAQKMRKVASFSVDETSNGIDSVFIEDSADGAIVIDDD